MSVWGRGITAFREALTAWRLMLAAILCLCASAPPGWFFGTGLLVLPGWMAFYALIGAGRRPGLAAWLVGLVHVLWFSFSLSHLFFIAWVPIGLVGGIYYLMAAIWTRQLTAWKVPTVVAFGLALAGTCWLRAHVSGITYPHAQPAHCLYHWPWLLGSARWGSEVLSNLLLGMLAAGLVDLWRAWRVAKPSFRSSVWWLGGTLTGAVLLTWLPPPGTPGTRPDPGRSVDVAAIEPRLGTREISDAREQGLESWFHVIKQRMGPPTVRLGGGGVAGVAGAPDLILWPEGFALHDLVHEPGSPVPRLHAHFAQIFLLKEGTHLLVGGDVVSLDAGDPSKITSTRIAAVQLDHRSRYMGHHEKIWLVPGGEYQPWFLRPLLPFLRRVFGFMPEITHGDIDKPLLQLADGTPYAAMVCFDNAVPEVARSYAERGARFLAVISNEAWYEGGSELDQMVAMSVFRTLETGLPMIRCTVDGATLALDADGNTLARLPSPADTSASPGVLRVRLPVRSGNPMPMAWLHRLLAWIVVLSGVCLAAPVWRSWGRLLRSQPSGSARSGQGPCQTVG